jgi:hypothetical protein
MAPYNAWPVLILCLSAFYLLIDRTGSPRDAHGFTAGCSRSGIFSPGCSGSRTRCWLTATLFHGSGRWRLRACLPCLRFFHRGRRRGQRNVSPTLKTGRRVFSLHGLHRAGRMGARIRFHGLSVEFVRLHLGRHAADDPDGRRRQYLFPDLADDFLVRAAGIFISQSLPIKKEKTALIAAVALGSFALCMVFGIVRLQTAQITTCA